MLAIHAFSHTIGGREVAGSLYQGFSPWVSGPLVGQSCPTAQTAPCRGLRATFAGTGAFLYGPAKQGRDGLLAANTKVRLLMADTVEIHHDQNQTHKSLIYKRAGRFLPASKFARFFGHFGSRSLAPCKHDASATASISVVRGMPRSEWRTG